MTGKKACITLVTVFAAAALLAAAQAIAGEPQGQPGVVNINTATVGELAFLPGVGPSKAEAIIKYRSKRPFQKVEQIMRVKGIGRKGFKKMRPYLALKGPTTVTKKIAPAK